MARRAQPAYDPFPKQWCFHTCPADDILYGGAAGPGKTRALIQHGYDYCRTVPGSRVVFFRRTTPQLRKPKRDARIIIPDTIARWNSNDSVFRFFATHPETGMSSEFLFSHMESEDHAFAWQGEEIDLILWDEYTLFTEFQHTFLRSRSRTTVPGSVTRHLAASNPGGITHTSVKKRYIKPEVGDADLLYRWVADAPPLLPGKPPGRWYPYPAGTRGYPEHMTVWLPDLTEDEIEANRERVEMGLDPLPRLSRCYIPALLKDNPILNTDGRYEANLRSMHGYSPALVRALLTGDWDVFEGQAFPEFREATHVVVPFTPPAHWIRWRSYDHGYAAPLAMHWHAMDPDSEQIVTYEELYFSPKAKEVATREIVQLVNARTPDGDFITQTVADPSLWSGGQAGEIQSMADIFANLGLELTKANNDRLTGKARVHEMLKINPLTGKPNWIITRNCRNLIRTLPELIYDDKRVEDVDTTGEDHAYDSCRYGLLAKPSSGGQFRFTEPMRAGIFRQVTHAY